MWTGFVWLRIGGVLCTWNGSNNAGNFLTKWGATGS